MRAMRRKVRWQAGGRGWAPAAAFLLLAGCNLPPEVNPVAIYNRISGADEAGRPPPPGMDRPTPNLASVPPRPERPPPELRQAITAGLAEDRTRSRDPLVLRTVPAPGGGAVTEGGRALLTGPPPRPVLSNAPRIPWADSAPVPAPRAPASPAAAPAAPAPALPVMPERAPAPPPPDLLGPPPAPRF